MSVIDLASGKPVVQDTGEPIVLRALKSLIKRIEEDGLPAESFYLIVDCGTKRHSFDSGITAEAAITMLERERFHILCMLEGIKV